MLGKTYLHAKLGMKWLVRLLLGSLVIALLALLLWEPAKPTVEIIQPTTEVEPMFGVADEIFAPTASVASSGGWGTVGRCYQAWDFTPTVTGTIASTTIVYSINNFPSHAHTDDTIMHIYASDGTSPTTSLGSEQYTPGDGYTPILYKALAWSPAIAVTSGTEYWLVYHRSGACDDASYYAWWGSASDVGGFNTKYSADGSSWTDETGQINSLVQIDATAASSPEVTDFEILGMVLE